uniref:Uncharacterized protein n=1 Tax=Kalanchoe fedtschenkoi TaxID=63787 RepID=A0A7N0UPJ7_KALFE
MPWLTRNPVSRDFDQLVEIEGVLQGVEHLSYVCLIVLIKLVSYSIVRIQGRYIPIHGCDEAQ